jgi:hypothetical protein
VSTTGAATATAGIAAATNGHSPSRRRAAHDRISARPTTSPASPTASVTSPDSSAVRSNDVRSEVSRTTTLKPTGNTSAGRSPMLGRGERATAAETSSPQPTDMPTSSTGTSSQLRRKTLIGQRRQAPALHRVLHARAGAVGGRV